MGLELFELGFIFIVERQKDEAKVAEEPNIGHAFSAHGWAQSK
jgi:hypothetical protein